MVSDWMGAPIGFNAEENNEERGRIYAEVAAFHLKH